MTKRFHTLIVFLIMLTISTIVLAQSQNDMTQEACEKYKTADRELTNIYRQILVIYVDDKIFIKKMKAAQQAWVIFKEAHLASRFPDEKKEHYGSVYPMCRCDLLTNITKARIEDLKLWFIGVDEGEVCLGSVKLKNDIKKSKRRPGQIAGTNKERYQAR